jgi:hypothetical protein
MAHYTMAVPPYFIRARPTPRPYAPPIELCALQPMQYNRSLHPAIQRGSHCGQSNSNFTLSEVNMALTLIGWTRALSDVTDGHVCPSIAVTTLSTLSDPLVSTFGTLNKQQC